MTAAHIRNPALTTYEGPTIVAVWTPTADNQSNYALSTLPDNIHGFSFLMSLFADSFSNPFF
jgi:hypothetical protein